MTRKEAFEEINAIQEQYVNELAELIDSPEYTYMKVINFTSATGTGKTKMMSKLMSRFPDCFFVVTTLSRGQLHLQVKKCLEDDCTKKNFIVYGSMDYTISSRLDAKDILSKIPNGKKCIWLRDEGHIKTNRFDALLADKCYKIINFSATNPHSDILCNFTQTMMLRTVNQYNGTPAAAIEKLLEVKDAHKNVPHYNPCAIFRCVGQNKDIYDGIIRMCDRHNLKYIDITDERFSMAELCEDDNEYDVIINKMKLSEGIDIRRAHVLYMDNQPMNTATSIQVIGRCRRNALLYRDDIDILAPENEKLLKATRECYVYYNVEKMKIDTDTSGELCYAFCNHISCQLLKAPTTIQVEDGQLPNGLFIMELEGQTGTFDVSIDEETGFNVVSPEPDFYAPTKTKKDQCIYIYNYTKERGRHYKKINVKNVPLFPVFKEPKEYYSFCEEYVYKDTKGNISDDALSCFYDKQKEYSEDVLYSMVSDRSADTLLSNCILPANIKELKGDVDEFIAERANQKGYKVLCKMLSEIDDKVVKVHGQLYAVEDICSENELIMLKYFYIEKKRRGEPLESVQDFIDSYFTAKYEYFHFKYAKEHSVSALLKQKYQIQYRASGVSEYVAKYVNDENNKKRWGTAYQYIAIHIPGTTQLRKSCSPDEIKLIQYHCIRCGMSEGESFAFVNEVAEFKNNILKNGYPEAEKLTYIILKNEISHFYNSFEPAPLTIVLTPEQIGSCEVKKDDVLGYFTALDKKEKEHDLFRIFYINAEETVRSIELQIQQTKDNLENGIIDVVKHSYAHLMEEVTEEEDTLLSKYRLRCFERGFAPKIWVDRELRKKRHVPYEKIENDRESTILGVDFMEPFSMDGEMCWAKAKSVSSKIGINSKLNSFLSHTYSEELNKAKGQCFRGKNNFELSKKCNSMIGYCVEYYSKYLVYGNEYLEDYITDAKRECKVEEVSNSVIVRACMKKYKDMMVASFGKKISKIIPTISAEQIVQDKYDYFVNLIIDLGTKTANYVKKTLYSNTEAENTYDPNLSVRYITGLADYITHDTILDVKVRNSIDEKNIRQVLAYHYLSTKRSDLDIKRVIVYDATSDRAIEIDISSQIKSAGY